MNRFVLLWGDSVSIASMSILLYLLIKEAILHHPLLVTFSAYHEAGLELIILCSGLIAVIIRAFSSKRLLED